MRLLIILFIFLFSCKKNEAKPINTPLVHNPVFQVPVSAIVNNISGKWQYVKKSPDSKVPEEMFTLNIVQNGNDIKAQYCAIANSGGKIDCENGEEFNVKGIVKDGKITAEFYSFFGSSRDKGSVEIIINNDNTLQWKVIQAPKGEFYAPDTAILTRKNSKETASAKNSKLSLPVSLKGISILDYPTPEKYKNIQIDGSTPTSVAELNDNVLILFFEGDTERWYLVTIKDSKIAHKLLIGKSETVETENGTTDHYIDFTIDKNFKINLEYSAGKDSHSAKTQKTESFQINFKNNRIEKL